MNKLIRVIVYGVLAVQTIDIVKQWKNVYNKAKALKATAEDYEIASLMKIMKLHLLRDAILTRRKVWIFKTIL